MSSDVDERPTFDERVLRRRASLADFVWSAMIPTEPIGSLPRPPALIEAMTRGDSDDPLLDPLYEDAIRDTIERFEATGSLALSRFSAPRSITPTCCRASFSCDDASTTRDT